MDSIVCAINAAKVMVLVFSENANNSDDIKREIVLAGDAKITVIPVRVEDVVPTGAFAYQLATRQWIDLFKDWEAQIDRLAKWIEGTAPANPNARSNSDLKNSVGDSPAIESEGRPQGEARQRADEEMQPKRDEAQAQGIAEDYRRQQARLAEEETQKKKAASEAAAPRQKKQLRWVGAVIAGIVVIVAFAIWFEVRHPSDTSATASQACRQAAEPSAEVAACTRAIALNPMDEIAFSNRCYAYSVLPNLSAALADCNQAIALEPKADKAYSSRCFVNINLGRLSAALADCNQAIALDPKNKIPYYNRGSIYEKLGTNADAIADYQKYLTIDPSDQDAQNALKRLGASPAAPGGR